MSKTVAEKLRIKPGAALWSSHPDRLGLLGPLPDGVRQVEAPGEADAALLFADDAASARALTAEHHDGLAHPELLWVAYPKGNRTDVNRDTLWPILSEHGLRPISQVAIDDAW